MTILKKLTSYRDSVAMVLQFLYCFFIVVLFEKTRPPTAMVKAIVDTLTNSVSLAARVYRACLRHTSILHICKYR